MKKILILLALAVLGGLAAAAARYYFESYSQDRELERMAESEASGKTSLAGIVEPEKKKTPRIAEETLGEGSDLIDLYAGQENVFITSDAAFELFRRFIERASDGIYGTFLYDQFASLFVDLTDNLEERYEKSEGEVRMTLRNALLFSAICVKLCIPDARIPVAVRSDVEEELKLIKEASFIGEKDGRPCDYTVYASFAEKSETPWGGAALLRAFLERRCFSLDDLESVKELLLLAEALFASDIASENYDEAARFLKAFDGETKVMTIKDLWQLAGGVLKSGLPEEIFSLAENGEFLNKIRPAAVSSFDPPPWRDPAQIAEPSPKVWFFQPALALAPRTFRELHRWVVQPKTDHLLYVLGAADSLTNSEEILLGDLKKEVEGRLGLMDRAVAAGASLKKRGLDRPNAFLVRSMLYTAEKPEDQAREAEWPKIKAVYVEDAPELFRVLAELIKELNELYTELDLFRVMTSYKKNTLTPDRLLEAEQIFNELADMAREDALYLESGEKEAVSGERALMNARRFLTLLSSQKTQDPPWEKETTLGLEYNFQKVSLAGLGKP
ncbi:DUF3160 domain-containing protein, partial [bacterium]|nr:DUF3160 domain-containing protein [bacterium]